MLLLREGWQVNAKRIDRRYTVMGLQLRNKTPKRRVKAKLREGRTEATCANQTWSMRCPSSDRFQSPKGDFVHDPLATGRKMRILTIVDIFSRLSPATDPRFSYPLADRRMSSFAVRQAKMWFEHLKISARSLVIRRQFVSIIVARQGMRAYPRGRPEIISRDLDLWAYQKNITLVFSRPGKPTDNAFIESFNGKFRAECLNTH